METEEDKVNGKVSLVHGLKQLILLKCQYYQSHFWIQCSPYHNSNALFCNRSRKKHSARLLCSWDSPGKNTGVDCHFLFQGIFPAHESNPGLLHCRQIIYYSSHQGSLFHVQWFVFVNLILLMYPSFPAFPFRNLLSLFSVSVSFFLFCVQTICIISQIPLKVIYLSLSNQITPS